MNNRFEKYIFVATILLFSSHFAFSQETEEMYARRKGKKDTHLDSINNLNTYRKNVIYIEGLGNAGIGLYSFNYERKIGENNNGFITARIGYNRVDATYGPYFFPLLINQIYNKDKNSHFEVGGGISLSLFTDPATNKAAINYSQTGLTANLMYRYQKPRGRFIFRIGWTPILYVIDTNIVLTFVALLDCGASIGFAF